MKTIIVLDSATVPHGAAFWARSMAEQLARRGHRVTLLCPSGSPLRDPPPGFGAAVRTVPLRNNFDLASVAALARWLRREHADVFLFQGSRGIRLGGLAARIAGVPGVARVGIGGGLKSTVYDRWLCRTAVAHFIANAASIERELTALPWVGPDRVTLIYNGIDVERFRAQGSGLRAQGSGLRAQGFDQGGPDVAGTLSPEPLSPEPPLPTKTGLRGELGIPKGAPVIAVVARLQAHKGHEELFRCLPELWERFSELRVLVAGQGPHESHLRTVVEGLGEPRRVLFLGHCPDVRPVLAAADLFALPSHREGLPNAVLEAMAMELPVVAAAADGTGEVVVDGETGLLVPPGDSPALGDALRRLLEDGALRDRLVRAARRRLEEQFSLPRAVDQVEALLCRLAGGPEEGKR